ncbi:MAG: hypothetical protein HYU33_02375 [Candidatus Omnitrophica bacterium]|nr:hypothetical protein [Candidatus Omnitrophota bacterium]
MKLWSCCLLLLAASVFTAGCGTSYYYLSGEKAQVAGTLTWHVFTQYAIPGKMPPTDQQALTAIHKQHFPAGKSRWEELTGVELQCKTGDTQEQVLEQIGEPVTKHAVSGSDLDETWEYDCCTVFFRRGKVKLMKFKEIVQPTYISQSPRWFDYLFFWVKENPRQ